MRKLYYKMDVAKSKEAHRIHLGQFIHNNNPIQLTINSRMYWHAPRRASACRHYYLKIQRPLQV